MSYIQYPKLTDDFTQPIQEPWYSPDLPNSVTYPEIDYSQIGVVQTPNFETYDKLVKLLEEKIEVLEEALGDAECDIIALEELYYGNEE